jgi:hypothetical protein
MSSLCLVTTYDIIWHTTRLMMCVDSQKRCRVYHHPIELLGVIVF